VVDRLSPDVLHAHFGRSGVKAVPIAKALGCPLVVTFYGYDVSRLPRERAWREVYRDIWDTADVIIGISNHICERLTSLGAPPDKVQNVSLGIDLSAFPYSDPTDDFDGDTVRCLHVGRLVEKKAPLHLVRAFHHAVQRLDGERALHLTIAGGGPLEHRVAELVERLGLGEKVSLLGAVSRERVQALMRKTHLYTQHCMTASDGDQEGQGVTFVEASATGRPVVSTWHNGIPDVVLDGETGVLVEEGDIEGMGDAIARLARAPETWRTYGKAGRAHMEECFDLSKQTQKQIQMYRRLAGAR
jgi:colanic acid/amylovoran biosynthesis glycosyltransferase